MCGPTSCTPCAPEIDGVVRVLLSASAPMLLFVALLIAATFASGAWCAGETLAGRAPAWWRTGRPVTASVVLLAAVVAVATGLRFLLVPGHYAMYLDEPWYAEAACNLARFGHLVVCEET